MLSFILFFGGSNEEKTYKNYQLRGSVGQCIVLLLKYQQARTIYYLVLTLLGFSLTCSFHLVVGGLESCFTEFR